MHVTTAPFLFINGPSRMGQHRHNDDYYSAPRPGSDPSNLGTHYDHSSWQLQSPLHRSDEARNYALGMSDICLPTIISKYIWRERRNHKLKWVTYDCRTIISKQGMRDKEVGNSVRNHMLTQATYVCQQFSTSRQGQAGGSEKLQAEKGNIHQPTSISKQSMAKLKKKATMTTASLPAHGSGFTGVPLPESDGGWWVPGDCQRLQ
ncbi:hypothetical protein EDD16DRAFT_1521000 [Pisolithus croceorrhizus]|nr:hypothetical protein EDD16DRAFT_1521000 [Pisolithus croceorrhizus]